MNTLNKNKSGAHTPLKRLVYLLTLCGFTTSSMAATFPTTPLHLQDETKTTTAAGVKLTPAVNSVQLNLGDFSYAA